MGFPLEELTQFDAKSGRIFKITKISNSKEAGDVSTDAAAAADDSTELPPDVAAILDSLQGPLPYIRRGAWGR